MSDIQIFEKFYKFKTIIKKQKKSKRIYKASLSQNKFLIETFIFILLMMSFSVFFAFIGFQLNLFLGILFFILGIMISSFSLINFKKKYLKSKSKNHKDLSLINYYSDYYFQLNETNIEKVKFKIKNIMSENDIKLFYKIKEIKNKAFKEYISKGKGISETDCLINKFDEEDVDFFLTLKYIITHADINDLRSIDGLTIKESIKDFNLDQQLELSSIINKRVLSDDYKKETIEYNLNLINKVKNKNIINI